MPFREQRAQVLIGANNKHRTEHTTMDNTSLSASTPPLGDMIRAMTHPRVGSGSASGVGITVEPTCIGVAMYLVFA